MPRLPRSSSPRGALRRALATGCAAAGLYAVLLGPVGALGQNPSPTATATPEPTATSVPETVQTAEPSPTSTSVPEETPAAEPTQAAPESTPAHTPESTPAAQPTPESTPHAEATPAADPHNTREPGARELVEDEHADEPRRKKHRAERTGKKRQRADRCDRDAHGDDGHGPKGSTSRRGSDCEDDEHRVAHRDRPAPIRRHDGTPTVSNPTLSIADVGAAPIGVPNFFIEKFRIPPFLLPIYQAAGMEYGVRWEVLAAINEIETDYGRNLNVSSAGALGWMQFMPPTWKAYGVDANKDGLKDPYNPVDAIFAAARYLRAAGAETDLRKAIFAYNHADWYVDSVLLRARLIGGLPSNFVGSLTGLTQARFPVYAKARYAGDLREREARRKVAEGHNAAFAVESVTHRRGIRIFSRAGAPVIAVNDGKIVHMGHNKRLGLYIKLQDVYGNVFTYGNLKSRAATYPAPRPRQVTPRQIARELDLPARDAAPQAAASAGSNRRRGHRAPLRARPAAAKPAKRRLFANPARPAARAAGGEMQLAEASYRPFADSPLRLSRRDYVAKRMRVGARVIAGTTLGRLGRTEPLRMASHLYFEIRPAGRGAPRIDPKPILDGWKLLESTEIYRAANRNPFFGPDAKTPSVGQILLMSKEALIRRVLSNPRIEIYECGRQDIRVGAIDRRPLAMLEFLAASGLKPTVTSLKCGHSYFTAAGGVSHHSSGNAVDIAAINGVSILGNQGQGSITEITVQRLLTLQGTMRPDQIITLMKFDGAENTFAMGDHHDHIHVGWRPLYGANSRAAKQVNAILKPDQWIELIARLRQIDNPEVRVVPSKYALRAGHKPRRASRSHTGE